MKKKLAPMHSGEVLREEFLIPLNLTDGKLARAIDVPRTLAQHIVQEKAPITADIATRLGKVFGNSSQFWLNLQSHCDLIRSVSRELE